jgi:hypothetical protein
MLVQRLPDGAAKIPKSNRRFVIGQQTIQPHQKRSWWRPHETRYATLWPN